MCENAASFQRIANTTKNAKVKQIFSTLATGEAELRLLSQPSQQSAILVLGNNNSSRGIFTRWIAGQGAKFESKPDETNPGEYVIVDSDKKADEAFPANVPILIANPEIGAFFYDIPGFADPRGVAYDIATTYFIKKVIKTVSSAKLCLLIEHYKTTYQHRGDLLNFLKQVTELIEYIENVKDSILLVVSKIPTKLSTTSDDEIIDTVVGDMQQLRKELVQETENNELENWKIIKFLDLITSKEKNVYSRMALFRSPNKPGSLSNLTVLEDNRIRIQEKLQNLSFTEITSDDFGYTLPELSFSRITAIKNETRADMIVNVKTSGNEIQQHFASKETAIKGLGFDTGLPQVYQQMRSGYKKMLALRKYAYKSNNLKECLCRITEGVAKITNDSVKLDLSATLDSVDALEFLHTISGGQRAKFTWCVNGLAKAIQYLDESRKWYFFTKNLYDRLVHCSISKNVGTYRVTDEDIEKRVSETELKVFLLGNTHEEDLFVQYDRVKDVVLTEFKLESAKLIANVMNEYTNWDQLCPENNSTSSNNLENILVGMPNDEAKNTTRNYLDKLYHLEDEFQKVQNRTLYLPHYTLMYNQVAEYIHNRLFGSETSYKGDHTVLNYLGIAILSRIQNLKSNFDDYLVINFVDYFSSLEDLINAYKEPFREAILPMLYQNEYQHTINKRIIKAYGVLDSIIPEMDTINKDINNEITRLIENANNSEKRNELAAQLSFKTLMGILQVFRTASMVWGPMGAVASSPRGLILSKVDGYLNPSEDSSKSMIDGAQQLTDSFKEMYPLERKRLLDHLSRTNIDRIDASPEVLRLIQRDRTFNDIKGNVMNFIRLLGDDSLDEINYWNRKKLVKGDLNRYLNYLSQAGRPEDDENTKKKWLALIKWTTLVVQVITVAESGLQDYEQSKNLISKVGDSMKQIDATINKLKEYEHSIRAKLLPEIDTIQKNMTRVLHNTTDSDSDARFTTLNKNEDMLHYVLQDFKNTIKLDEIPTFGSPIMQKIKACTDKLIGRMGNSVQMYNLIQEYTNQIRLLQYFDNLSNETDDDNPSIRSDPEDPSFSRDVERLELRSRANLILLEQKRALATFQRYMFPFDNYFPSHFDETSDNINLISQFRKDMDSVRQTFGKLPDIIFPDVRFDVENVDRNPFFIWRYNTHKQKISKLLQGHEITLEADIIKSPDVVNAYLNAVKFNEIGIRFVLSDKNISTQLSELLVHFRVQMTHLGDSHYRCDDKYYTFEHNMISMTHAVITTNDGQNNPHYDYPDTNTTNLKQNLPIFSPYASWRILLLNASSSNQQKEKNFRKLQTFQNNTMDIALEGRGEHIQFHAESCKSKPKSFDNPERTFFSEHSHEHYHYNPNAPFDTNSAKGIKSPINIAVNWLAGSLGYFASFWLPPTKYSSRSIFNNFKMPNVCPTKDYFRDAVIRTEFNVLESLTLADFFIRWLTKVKPYNNNVNESMNSIEIRAIVLNLMEQVQTSIKFNVTDESTQFDPVTLISRLEKKLMISQNVTAKSKALYQTFVNANPHLGQSPLSDYIWQKITESVLE